MSRKDMDMSDRNPTRRDFTKLAMAALGGVVAGTAALSQAADQKKDEGPWLNEPHVCRGLNACEGRGVDKKNKCAGQGACATAKKHSCHGENDCKGQGGCGAKPGENACKGMGECSVPLSEDGWKKARTSFEAAMKKAGKKVGEAPKK